MPIGMVAHNRWLTLHHDGNKSEHLDRQRDVDATTYYVSVRVSQVFKVSSRCDEPSSLQSLTNSADLYISGFISGSADM
jgi:hypothetical protein